MDPKELDIAEHTAKAIRDTFTRLDTYRKDPAHHDKVGYGVNLDPRFSAVSFSISIDSWHGVYGHSGCGTILSVPDRPTFINAFERVLNRNLRRLLIETADTIDAGLKDAREARLKELRIEVARLETVLGSHEKEIEKAV